MADIVLFQPKAELDAAENLRGFIYSCRNELTVYGADLPFDQNTWDITDSINLKGHGNKRHRLVFSKFEAVNDTSFTPMSEPFLSFAKAYFRYMQGFRPTNGTGPRLSALRALEASLRESGGDANPIRANIHTFNRAAQMIVDKYSVAVAYRCGGQLEMLSEFLCDNKLLNIMVRWRNFIKRPGDTVRVGKEFDERRKDKMPTQAALDALPEIYRMAVEPIDVIVTSVSAILFSSPDRISEVLSLPLDCEVNQEDSKNGKKIYGIRWWPAKGADPMVKEIVDTMGSVVQEAIVKIKKVTDKARRVARWYEENPDQIYLSSSNEYLRSQEYLSMEDLNIVMGFSERSSSRNWCNKNSIQIRKLQNRSFVRLSDVEKVVVGMLPKGFPVMNKDTGLKYSEAMFVVRTNELGSHKSTLNCMIESVTINQINYALGGRVEHGFPSIFTKFGYVEPYGGDINISSHQFRHYLNTLAQAGGLSQIDIAKWSGRKDIKQNAAYDHVTPGQMVQKIREAIGDESVMFGPLAELSKKTLIPRDEFARLIVPTAHTTDLGYCIHDYTMSPCQIHMDCINCSDLICIKGDGQKEIRLRTQLDEAKTLLEKAELATKEQYYGSDRWLEHHQTNVERLSELLSIMDNPLVPIGAVIQLSPPKSSTHKISMQKRSIKPAEIDRKPTKTLEIDVSSKG